MPRYSIVRYYEPSQGKPSRVVKKGLTLEEATRHCSNPKTHKKGVYFDGYQEEK